MDRPLAAPSVRAARLGARALTVLAAAALAAPAARAQTATLTFNGLTATDASGVRYVDNCYQEAGFQVAAVGLGCGTAAGGASALASWTPDNPDYYTGSPALYSNFGNAIDFTAVGGQAFSFRSIGLSPFLGQLGEPTMVMFTGSLATGGTVSQSVMVPGGVFGRTATPVMFASFTGFTNLRSLRLAVNAPSGNDTIVQFDNVSFGPAAVVPEPATVALFGAGLAGLAAVARRRRTA